MSESQFIVYILHSSFEINLDLTKVLAIQNLTKDFLFNRFYYK